MGELLDDLGEACAEYQDGVLQTLPCKVVEVREILVLLLREAEKLPGAVQRDAGLRATSGPSSRFAPTRSSCLLAGRLVHSTHPTDGHRIYEGTVSPAFRQNVDLAQI